MSPELFYGNYTTGADGRLYARGGLRDCLSVWGSLGPFDVNTASPALMEAMGMTPEMAASIVATRQQRPFQNPQELAGTLPPRIAMGSGYSIYTLRASARLRRPDGSYSEVVRTAAATIKLFDPQKSPQAMHILRWYDDAWSQAALPPYPGMTVRGGNVPGTAGLFRRLAAMSLLRTLIPDGLKKWLAFGHGVGIEVVGPHGGESLRVTAVRVHPGGARVVGTLSFEDAMHQCRRRVGHRICRVRAQAWLRACGGDGSVAAPRSDGAAFGAARRIR